MKYANPTPPEGINTGGYRPVREFIVLLGALVACVGVGLVVVYQFGGWLAPYVPFAWERQVEAPFVSAFVGDKAAGGETQAQLQRLVDRLVPLMELPDDMTVRVHYVADERVNALATIGGNMVVFQGLLARMPNEDALAMVLAHEIAHVKHRDVLASLGGGVIVSTALSVVLNDSGAVGDLINTETLFTALHYSRAKETRADEAALGALVRLYGHGGGAKDLFHLFQDVERELGLKRKRDFMATHPLTDKRLGALNAIGETQGWAMDGARTPLLGAMKVARPPKAQERP